METNTVLELSPDYTVQTILGCRIVFGQIPMRDFCSLANDFSQTALMDAAIASRIGAALVIGEPEDLEQLRKTQLPASRERQRHFEAASSAGMHLVALWLRDGERGASSNALCQHLFDLNIGAGKSHPRDPDDLRRCVLFLDATQAHDKIARMRNVSPAWAGLVAVWDPLIAQLREELSTGDFAQKTYAMMLAALAPCSA